VAPLSSGFDPQCFAHWIDPRHYGLDSYLPAYAIGNVLVVTREQGDLKSALLQRSYRPSRVRPYHVPQGNHSLSARIIQKQYLACSTRPEAPTPAVYDSRDAHSGLLFYIGTARQWDTTFPSFVHDSCGYRVVTVPLQTSGYPQCLIFCLKHGEYTLGYCACLVEGYDVHVYQVQ
jgi:hypothetical protein